LRGTLASDRSNIRGAGCRNIGRWTSRRLQCRAYRQAWSRRGRAGWAGRHARSSGHGQLLAGLTGWGTAVGRRKNWVHRGLARWRGCRGTCRSTWVRWLIRNRARLTMTRRLLRYAWSSAGRQRRLGRNRWMAAGTAAGHVRYRWVRAAFLTVTEATISWLRR